MTSVIILGMQSLGRTAKIIIAMFVIGCCLFTVAVAKAAGPSAQVDFGRLTHPKNQMGFMHGAINASRNSSARSEIVSRAYQLQPGLWRGANAFWSFNLGVTQEAGATPIHILSDQWISVTPQPKPGCNEMFLNRSLPFQNLTAWRDWVIARAQELGQNQPSGTIWVDIWNEPDWYRFWPTKRNDRCFSKNLVDTDGSKWLNTFLVAEQALRKTLGSRVKIIGPSAATSVTLWTTKLINFCAAKGCRVDAISWHLCGGTQGSVDKIIEYTGKLRASLARDSKWRKASAGGATPVWMTEYMPAPMHLLTGAYTSYWYALERAGVDGGALAEWNDQDASLDSLLERNGTPRSLWWAAKAYADGRESRVLSQTSSGYYSLLASRSGLGGVPQILIGNNNASASPVSITLRGLHLAGLTKSLRLRTYVLPVVSPGKNNAMPQLPQPVLSRSVAISRDTATVQVTPPRGGALLVDLTNG